MREERGLGYGVETEAGVVHSKCNQAKTVDDDRRRALTYLLLELLVDCI